MTRDQAFACLHALLGGKKETRFMIHLEAILGFGNVPTVTDFEGTDERSIDNSDGFLAYVREWVGLMEEISQNRPRQKSIDFGGKPKTEDTDLNRCSICSVKIARDEHHQMVPGFDGVLCQECAERNEPRPAVAVGKMLETTADVEAMGKDLVEERPARRGRRAR